jgi:hypothetical protein
VKDVAARLAELETIQHMMDDEYLRGDLLLLAIVILDSLHRTNKLNTKLIHARTGWDIYNIKRIVEKDIPRYEPAESSWTCTVPLVRKEGNCDQSASNHHRIRNPENGEWENQRTCSRHEPGMRALERAKRMEWQANGAPTPANNTGGGLTRYFHTDELYDWATPEWKKGADRTPPIPRPKLKVIQEAAPDITPATRPAFTVIKGAR